MNTKNAIILAITLFAVAAVTVLYAAPVPVAAAPLQYSGPARANEVECYRRNGAGGYWDYTDQWWAGYPPSYYSYNPNDYPCGVLDATSRTQPFNFTTRTLSYCHSSDNPAYGSTDISATLVLSSSCSTYTADVNISSWPRSTDAGAPAAGYYTLRGGEGWGLIWQTAAGQTGPAYNVQYSTDCDGLYWTYSQDFGFYC